MKRELEQYLPMFIEEAKEHLQEMNTAFLKLEKNPEDMDSLNRSFRAAHTLKGMAATLEFRKLSNFCHEIEDVLDLIRKKEKSCSSQVMDLLFSSLDVLEKSLKQATSVKNENNIDFGPLLKLISTFKENKSFEMPKDASSGALLRPKEDSIVSEIKAIKVPIKRMDSLLNLAGELVTLRGRLHYLASQKGDSALESELATLDRLGDRIRDEVMGARMMPLEQVFQKFPRMVRDIAHAQQKEVEISVIGGDIEMDRTVLDKIDMPLVHLLRNAIDHGIESTGERKAKGKPLIGKIKLSAIKERESVMISLEDDGQGIDVENVKSKLIEKKIKSKDEIEKMSDSDVCTMLFYAGVSTSKEITETSGRGVGMNSIKSLVESLGGFAKIESEKGKYTRVIMKIPLSLAIIKTILVSSNSEVYAFPLSNILRILRVPESDIKTIEEEEVIIFEDNELPIVRLTQAFGTDHKDLSKKPAKSDKNQDRSPKKDENRAKGSFVTVLVVLKGIGRLGVVVDAVLGEQETIVKPIDQFGLTVRLFSGASVMGDGKVVLIPDVSNLTQEAIYKVRGA